MSSPAPATTSATTSASTSTTTSTTTSTATKAKSIKSTAIKAIANFSQMVDAVLVILAFAVLKGLTNNPAFTNLPIDMAAFSTLVTTYSNAIQAALDNGNNAKAARDKARKAVIADLKQLVVYVEGNCNDDMTTFLSSGFQAQTPAPATNGVPAAVPTIRTLDYGSNSGSITATIAKVAGAKVYMLRYAPMANGVPGTWTSVVVASVGKKTTISGLTPGTTYAFEVQAVGTNGTTDWSDSMTLMCA